MHTFVLISFALSLLVCGGCSKSKEDAAASASASAAKARAAKKRAPRKKRKKPALSARPTAAPATPPTDEEP